MLLKPERWEGTGRELVSNKMKSGQENRTWRAVSRGMGLAVSRERETEGVAHTGNRGDAGLQCEHGGWAEMQGWRRQLSGRKTSLL